MIENVVGEVVDLSERYPDECNYWLDDPNYYTPDVGETMFIDNVLPAVKRKSG